ncbi:hypothetical protein THIOM_002265 [Candidatus Thiomargarita nelsonii]|uniref:Uncharacterized protein n=1 Tax=Candidatus Thiomargarita nelsonii TaxID=1003181 RepID=A0A176S1N1_9GAMM|nr:hypothetical protein THIOM_002265 [Candidatus Thiomargarita nelsonii]
MIFKFFLGVRSPKFILDVQDKSWTPNGSGVQNLFWTSPKINLGLLNTEIIMTQNAKNL